MQASKIGLQTTLDLIWAITEPLGLCPLIPYCCTNPSTGSTACFSLPWQLESHDQIWTPSMINGLSLPLDDKGNL